MHLCLTSCVVAMLVTECVSSPSAHYNHHSNSWSSPSTSNTKVDIENNNIWGAMMSHLNYKLSLKNKAASSFQSIKRLLKMSKPWSQKPMKPWPQKPMKPWPQKPMKPWPQKPMKPWPQKPMKPWPQKPMKPWPQKPMKPWPQKPMKPWPQKPVTPNPWVPITEPVTLPPTTSTTTPQPTTTTTTPTTTTTTTKKPIEDIDIGVGAGVVTPPPTTPPPQIDIDLTEDYFPFPIINPEEDIDIGVGAGVVFRPECGCLTRVVPAPSGTSSVSVPFSSPMTRIIKPQPVSQTNNNHPLLPFYQLINYVPNVIQSLVP